MKVTFSFNDEILVKLTNKGEEHYTKEAVWREPVNDSHVYSFPIWYFMKIFGGRNDITSYIADNKLVIREEDNYETEITE